MTGQLATAFIGLGSNLGGRRGAIDEALCELGDVPDITLQAVSAYYESPALLPEDAPEAWDRPFLNVVAQIATVLPPLRLLAVCQQIESLLGRQVRGKWGPREIDIDLLAMEDIEMISAALILPHPEIEQRDFVLLPWNEIAPQWRLPNRNGHSIAQLTRRLPHITARRVFNAV